MKNNELIKQLKALKEEISSQTEINKRSYDRMQNIAGLVNETTLSSIGTVQRSPAMVFMEKYKIDSFIFWALNKANNERHLINMVNNKIKPYNFRPDVQSGIIDYAKKKYAEKLAYKNL